MAMVKNSVLVVGNTRSSGSAVAPPAMAPRPLTTVAAKVSSGPHGRKRARCRARLAGWVVGIGAPLGNRVGVPKSCFPQHELCYR